MPDHPPDSMSTWEMYRSLIFSVYLPSFFMSICQGSILLVIPLFALDLGEGAGVAAIVFSLRGLGNMMADIPAGYSSARFGDRTTMLIGVGLMTLTGLIASQAGNAVALGASALFFGGAMATWLISRLTHISEAIPPHQRGKAISTMAGLQRLGNLVGPVASGAVAVRFGFETVFIGVAIISAAAFLMVVFFVPANRKGREEGAPDIIRLLPHTIGTHRRIFATAGLAILLLTILRAGRQLLVPLWGKSIGLDASDIGLIMGFTAAIDMTMFPAAGFIMDNLGRRYSAILCLGGLSLGLLLVPLTGSYTSLLLASTLIGLGNGLGSGINMTLGADFAPAGSRGEFLGVWRLMGDSGSFAGPVLMGYIASTFLLSTAFTITAGLGIIGILLMWFFVRETLEKLPG